MRKKFAAAIVSVFMIISAFALAGCDEETHTHTFSDKWSADGVSHWHAATCGHDEVSDKADHSFADGVCVTCGYKKADEQEKPEIEADYAITKEQWASELEFAATNFTYRSDFGEQYQIYKFASGKIYQNYNDGGGEHEGYSHYDDDAIWSYTKEDEGWSKRDISGSGNGAVKPTFAEAVDYMKLLFSLSVYLEPLKNSYENALFDKENNVYAVDGVSVKGSAGNNLSFDYTVDYTVRFYKGKLVSFAYDVTDNNAGAGSASAVATVKISAVGSTTVELPTATGKAA